MLWFGGKASWRSTNASTGFTREAGFAVRRRKRRLGVAVERQRLESSLELNQVWSMDSVSDALANGRRIKVLTIVDDFSKEAVDLVAAFGVFWAVCNAGTRSGSSFPWLPQGDPTRPRARVHRKGARPLVCDLG